ncbi:hypothetical protein V3H18_16075 [Methylocystis sp. 9N]|uniref:Uncharacterized protein n=1 Tax=Methylocystis borbori TaxID=3118750 RepID=A0ABU7XKZ8_9HYPH
MVNNPSISINKLGEYIISRAARQRKILHDRKYPDPDFQIGTYHREAAEAVSQFISNGAIDTDPIDKALRLLEQQTPEKIGTARRINANIDALERFSAMLDDIDLEGAEPSLGSNSSPMLTYHNVAISVRPEIILKCTKKNKKYIGAIKLHFSKSHPHDDESAGYVSAALNEFCKTHLSDGTEIVNPEFCKVIDVASGKVFKGVKSTKQRLADIAAECQNIAALWPTI